jgi:hypothetical protein
MKAFLEDFSRTIEAGKKQLLAIPEEQAAVELPGKWSAKQIVGHLIDSAANNHQRFVRAQTTNDLICPGYDQEVWVATQAYDQESWFDLVQLWSTYNRHLLHFISAMPADVLTRERKEHNLDVLAFKAVPKNTPTTLEYFVRDYADHMVHHLTQILGHKPTS